MNNHMNNHINDQSLDVTNPPTEWTAIQKAPVFPLDFWMVCPACGYDIVHSGLYPENHVGVSFYCDHCHNTWIRTWTVVGWSETHTPEEYAEQFLVEVDAMQINLDSMKLNLARAIQVLMKMREAKDAIS